MDKVVAFDLDGTLLNSADDLMLALNTLLEEIGIRKVNKNEISSLVGNGALAMIEKALELNGKKIKERTRLVKRFIEIYKNCFLKKTQLYPHAKNVLEDLYYKKIKMILVSNKSEFFVHKILEHFKIKVFFSAISGGDTFKFKKPDSRHLTETIKLLKIDKYNCTFIGDGINDAICAKNSSSNLILMSYGYSKDDINKMGADLITNDLRDIPKYLKI